jgi:stearoyl-CoA desaturase (Delta-9 desaturase)
LGIFTLYSDALSRHFFSEFSGTPMGKKRYETKDTSRNNFIIAILTFGEGWHNNHHHYPGSARQGFYWWEIDLTYYVLKFLAMMGVIWDVRTVSDNIRESKKIEHLHH